MERMEGKRIPDDSKPWDMNPGEYMDYKGRAFVMPPDGVGPLDVSSWSNTWHEDGTLTVSPSIQRHPVNDPSRPGSEVEWHGFLERGVWRTA